MQQLNIINDPKNKSSFGGVWHPGEKDKYWTDFVPNNLKDESCKKCIPQIVAVEDKKKVRLKAICKNGKESNPCFKKRDCGKAVEEHRMLRIKSPIEIDGKVIYGGFEYHYLCDTIDEETAQRLFTEINDKVLLRDKEFKEEVKVFKTNRKKRLIEKYRDETHWIWKLEYQAQISFAKLYALFKKKYKVEEDEEENEKEDE